jgi:phosphotransferase system HPr-like phosphotransfer protein
MVKGTVRLRSEIGLHARPSLCICQRAKEYDNTEITIENPENGMKADAKSILSLLSLAVDGGKTVSLVVRGPEEEKAYKEIADILENFMVE